MQTDPALEWRRLSEHYRAMGDEELRELAYDFGDLTEQAQQALSAEMQTRGMGRPQDATNAARSEDTWQVAAAPSNDRSVDSDWSVEADPSVSEDRTTEAFGYIRRPPEIVADAPSTDDEDNRLHDYTWLTYLCECETKEQARQLCEVLRAAKIDCAIKSYGLVYPQVDVAADQLDAARAIAAQPVPQRIVEESKIEAPEYEPPVCPKCGAKDPVLEGVDPENTWHCEQCGELWTESAVSADEEAGQSS